MIFFFFFWGGVFFFGGGDVFFFFFGGDVFFFFFLGGGRVKKFWSVFGFGANFSGLFLGRFLRHVVSVCIVGWLGSVLV